MQQYLVNSSTIRVSIGGIPTMEDERTLDIEDNPNDFRLRCDGSLILDVKTIQNNDKLELSRKAGSTAMANNKSQKQVMMQAAVNQFNPQNQKQIYNSQIPQVPQLSEPVLATKSRRGRPRLIKNENDPLYKNKVNQTSKQQQISKSEMSQTQQMETDETRKLRNYMKYSENICPSILSIVNNQSEKLLLSDQVNYFRLHSLKIKFPNELFEEIQDRCQQLGFNTMISFQGFSKNLMSIVDIICRKSQEAFHLNEMDSHPGNCMFRLEYSKRDDSDYYQLNKFELNHTHSTDEQVILQRRFRKLELIEQIKSRSHITNPEEEGQQSKSFNFLMDLQDQESQRFVNSNNNSMQSEFQPFICLKKEEISKSSYQKPKIQKQPKLSYNGIFDDYGDENNSDDQSNDCKQISASQYQAPQTGKIKLQRDIRHLIKLKRSLRDKLGLKGKGRGGGGRWKQQINLESLNIDQRQLMRELIKVEKQLKDYEQQKCAKQQFLASIDQK
eukprot:403341982